LKNKLINKNILVIGDSIIDKDIYVSDLGKSLETDNAKFKFINQTFELGGASRLVNFISTFDVNIVFFSNLEEQYFKEFSNLFSKLEIYKTNTTSSVEKIRIKLKNDNIFETVFQINKDYKSKHNSYSEILNILNKTFDAVLIDDYRTGMFDKQLIDIVNNLSYEKILFASQDGQRSDFNTKELIKSYLKHPLMTFKIISAIHFEAFKLWIKGIKFIKKKFKIKNNITFEK